MKWPERPVEEFCSWITSGGTPSTANDAYYGGDIPWLRTQEVTFNRITDTEIKITEAGLENSAAKWIPPNSVVVAMYGNSAGRSAITKIPLTTNQACCNLVVDPRKGDYQYVFYALVARYETLKGLSRGAAQNNLNAAQVREFKLPAPPVPVQQEIGSTLAAYDDLIENNRRRIQLLEESARLLYKEWFVHLRFPGHEHVGVVDGVPKGWQRRRVSELSTYLNRGIAPSYDDEGDSLVLNQRCIRDRLLSLENARRQNKPFAEEKQVLVGDVLVNSTGTGTLGRVAQVWAPVGRCTVDSHVTIVRPAEEFEPLWFGFSLIGLEKLFESMGEGATNQTELKREKIGSALLLVPERRLRQQFDLFAKDVVQQITNLSTQIARLIQARDLLLPKLMSGEITV